MFLWTWHLFFHFHCFFMYFFCHRQDGILRDEDLLWGSGRRLSMLQWAVDVVWLWVRCGLIDGGLGVFLCCLPVWLSGDKCLPGVICYRFSCVGHCGDFPVVGVVVLMMLVCHWQSLFFNLFLFYLHFTCTITFFLPALLPSFYLYRYLLFTCTVMCTDTSFVTCIVICTAVCTAMCFVICTVLLAVLLCILLALLYICL